MRNRALLPKNSCHKLFPVLPRLISTNKKLNLVIRILIVNAWRSNITDIYWGCQHDIPPQSGKFNNLKLINCIHIWEDSWQPQPQTEILCYVNLVTENQKSFPKKVLGSCHLLASLVTTKSLAEKMVHKNTKIDISLRYNKKYHNNHTQ